MSELILSIDQGTTGTTVLLIDEKLNVRGKGYREFRQIYPQPGWVEHDSADIWASVLAAITEAIQTSGLNTAEIACIGITNQRETNLVWDRKTGRPCHNAIVWQCRRTSEIVEDLKSKGYETLFQKRTGLLLDPYFRGTTLKWQLATIAGPR